MPIQPTLRYQAANWLNDSEEKPPHDMDGVSYEPQYVLCDVEITGAANLDFFLAGKRVFIERVDLFVIEALDDGTVEVGVSDNADALIDTADYTETTAGQHATNVGSSNADNPKGLYLKDGGQVRITVAGSATEGRVAVLLKIWDLTHMLAHGSQFVLTA